MVHVKRRRDIPGNGEIWANYFDFGQSPPSSVRSYGLVLNEPN